jgi:hypothetical protein
MADLTLAQMKAIDAALQPYPQWADGLMRDLYSALPDASSFSNQEVEAAVETVLAKNGLAQLRPSWIFVFGPDVLPPFRGAGALVGSILIPDAHGSARLGMAVTAS